MVPGPVFPLLLNNNQPTLCLFTVHYFTANTVFHTIHLILCGQQNRWDWQPHCLVGAKYLLCCVQVPRCPHRTPSPAISSAIKTPSTVSWRRCWGTTNATPSEATPFSSWFDKPWFHTEGKLAAVHHHHLKPGIPNADIKQFSGAVAGEKKHFCEGSSLTHNLLLCF